MIGVRSHLSEAYLACYGTEAEANDTVALLALESGARRNSGSVIQILFRLVPIIVAIG